MQTEVKAHSNAELWRRTFNVPAGYYQGFGPISALVQDPSVTEVMVLSDGEVFVEVGGEIRPTTVSFPDHASLISVINHVVGSVGREVSEDRPLCDARLLDGSRAHVALPPVAVDGPTLTIRKFPATPLGPDDLVRLHSATPAVMAVLEAAVLARANIVISGGTSSGKTTLLNILSGFIPPGERIVTIEDAVELQLHQRHIARLESQPGRADRQPVSMRDLVITSLRMRPDRIVVGEVRGPEALDMLQAMNTGHDGSMTTVHANRPRDTISRLETMVLMAGIELPILAIRQQIASAVNLFVHTERFRTGQRGIVQVSEVTGMEEGTISMQDLFRYAREPGPEGTVRWSLRSTGMRPVILERLLGTGIPIPAAIMELYPDMGLAAARWEPETTPP